jgi:hypothetical protein
VENLYFELTRELNAEGPIAALASGQAGAHQRAVELALGTLTLDPLAKEVRAMEMLSEDDLNLRQMTEEELDLAWDLWFDLAQATNDFDPPYTHGVFVLCQTPPAGGPAAEEEEEGSASVGRKLP